MRHETITVTPVTPQIGAEIGNIDLARPLSNRQVEELHRASADHLVIFFRDHRVTGRTAIYVNTDFTAPINGPPREEGERILRFLIDHCSKAEWTCRFRWRPHSIAFWDNRAGGAVLRIGAGVVERVLAGAMERVLAGAVGRTPGPCTRPHPARAAGRRRGRGLVGRCRAAGWTGAGPGVPGRNRSGCPGLATHARRPARPG